MSKNLTLTQSPHIPVMIPPRPAISTAPPLRAGTANLRRMAAKLSGLLEVMSDHWIEVAQERWGSGGRTSPQLSGVLPNPSVAA